MNLCGSVVKALNLKSYDFARVGSNPAADAVPGELLKTKHWEIAVKPHGYRWFNKTVGIDPF